MIDRAEASRLLLAEFPHCRVVVNHAGRQYLADARVAEGGGTDDGTVLVHLRKWRVGRRWRGIRHREYPVRMVRVPLDQVTFIGRVLLALWRDTLREGRVPPAELERIRAGPCPGVTRHGGAGGDDHGKD